MHEAAKESQLDVCQALLDTPNINPNPTDKVRISQNTMTVCDPSSKQWLDGVLKFLTKRNEYQNATSAFYVILVYNVLLF